jgi:hypothetical protein
MCLMMECVKVVEPHPARDIAALHITEEPFVIRREIMTVMRRPTECGRRIHDIALSFD